MHRAHLVERIGGKEHDAVVDWRERRMCRRARGAVRCDPGVVELQLPAGEALGSFVEVVDARDAATGDDGRAGVDVRPEEAADSVYRQLPLDLADRNQRYLKIPP